ncbi:MAG: zinc-dependent metalloprotease [Actinomycetota bacterium]
MSEDDPFEGVPFLGDLAKLLQQQGDQSWAAAGQMAMAVATGGDAEPNVDPLARIQLEELARVAELQMDRVTGRSASVGGRPVRIEPVTRVQWVQRSLPAYQALLEKVAGSIAAPPPEEGEAPDVFGGLMAMMGPLMMGMAAGSMVGHLARASFGQYDLPIPRPPEDDLMVLVGNLDEFAEQWTLPDDDLRLWVCLHELAHHTVLGVPHIGDRLRSLLERYAAGFQPDPRALEERLGGLDLGALDPGSADPSGAGGLEAVFGDPEMLLGAVRSPAQEQLQPELHGLIALITGLADHFVDESSRTLLGDADRISEALRRRRVTEDQSTRFVQQLLGIELTADEVARGQAFVAGVIDREGPEALQRLWEGAELLPTPAEVDAPGLWLARIEYEGES